MKPPCSRMIGGFVVRWCFLEDWKTHEWRDDSAVGDPRCSCAQTNVGGVREDGTFGAVRWDLGVHINGEVDYLETMMVVDEDVAGAEERPREKC